MKPMDIQELEVAIIDATNQAEIYRGLEMKADQAYWLLEVAQLKMQLVIKLREPFFEWIRRTNHDNPSF